MNVSFFLSFFFFVFYCEKRSVFSLRAKGGDTRCNFNFFFFFFLNFKAKRVKEFSTWGTDRDLFVGDKGSPPPMLGQWPRRPWC